MTLTPDAILSACRNIFPDRAGLSIQSINPLSTSSHPMVAFFLHGASDRPQPLIFRRYASPLSWHHLGEIDRAAREDSVLRALQGCDLPVPPAVGYGRDDSGEWLIQGALPGRNWWLPIGLVDFERVLPGIVRQHVRHLARLHSLDTASLVKQADLPVITIQGVIDHTRELAREASDLDVVSAFDDVARLLVEVEEREPRLIQVDNHISNVLVNAAGEVAGWVDWDDAALGDPRWDVAALANSLRGDYQLHALAARAIADYGRETVRPVKGLTAWTALFAVLRWAGAAWMRDQLKQGRGFDFPAADRFVTSYDSHRAWALEILGEAREEAAPYL